MRNELKEVRNIIRFCSNFIVSDIDDCWEWKASKSGDGYGAFYMDNKNISAHRASWQLYFGDIGNLYVLHRCDNKICINPNHLFLGTALDNSRDMVKKGRTTKLEVARHRNSKLSEETVIEIRKKLSLGSWGVATKLKKEYGVSDALISLIRSNKIWVDV